MKIKLIIIFLISFLFGSENLCAQHQIFLKVKVDIERHKLYVHEVIKFKNETGTSLNSIVLNDWNNAFSSIETPLAKRFSDEFVRSFYFSRPQDKGFTKISNFTYADNIQANFRRIEKQPDLIEILLDKPLRDKDEITFTIDYELKIPADDFTGYGFKSNDDMSLKNWHLAPARFENGNFVRQSNTNTEDIANANADFTLEISSEKNVKFRTDLAGEENVFFGNNKQFFSLYISQINDFKLYRNTFIDVDTDLKTKLDDNQKAILIDKMVRFVNKNIGKYPHIKIIVSQSDYDKYPFYGLNQLPSFLSPFTNEFIFEIKFLKTYLNSFLQNSLSINQRKDNWINDAVQQWVFMKYIDENYPDAKMMGSLEKWRLLRSYNLVTLPFNQQFNYFYLLNARENQDQPIGDYKDSFTKYNEQIALKYKAGLALKYLDNFLQDSIVARSVKQFYDLNLKKQTDENDFQNILTSNSKQNIDWFFNNVVHSKKIIDYKFTNVSATKDSVSFKLKNKTQNNVPISVFGIKNKKIVFKKWISDVERDSTFTFARNAAERIVLNYNSEVPEFNQRNNTHKIDGFFPNNRPVKFAFMKDLEDPKFNQLLYVPTFSYNLYDGIALGFSLHNKTLLDKPFVFNVEPTFATATKSLTGSFSFSANQNVFDRRLYRITYNAGASYSHYARDAGYSRISPGIYFNFRDLDLRSNRRQLLLMRYIFVNREKLDFPDSNINIKEQNYNVLNFKYIDTKTELARHLSWRQDLQFSKEFGKISTELQYRKLFANARQISLRLYAGSFLYNQTSGNFFNFALDRPTDYLFDYNYIGRSENSGLVSQQLIIAEGGFKTQFKNPFSNQLLVATNASFNVWNWVEIYGDVGFIKNKNQNGRLLYNSGIRLNLVPDYFELFLPVHASNGWQFDGNYSQKIRFVVTLSPQILVNLVKRRWF